ncbi:MAG: MFS transporter [Bacteroidota bacterium]
MEKQKQGIILKATLLIVSSMTVMAGATIAPALPQIEEHFSNYPSAEFLTQLMLTLPGFFIAIFSPIFGNLIDRFGRKPALLGSLFLYGVSGTAGIYISDLYALLASRAVLGIAVSGIMTITNTLVGDYFEGEERSNFVGFRGSFVAFGGVVFVGLAGFLAELGWRVPFGIYALALLVLPVAALSLYEPELSKTKKSLQKDEIPDYPRMWVRFVWVVAFVGMLMFYNIPTLMPFYLKEVIGLQESQVGMFIGGAMFSGGLAGFFYGKVKNFLSFNTIYAICFFLMALCFLTISQTESAIGSLVGMVFGGLSLGLISPNHALCLMNSAPDVLRGRVLGMLATFVFIGQFLSPVVSRFVRDWMGSISSMFLVYAIFLGVCSIGFWIKRL